MKRAIILSTLLLLSGIALGQSLKLSFMSESGARFYVYLNGKLQNETSVGIITIDSLEDKEYHVRIEIDDPYQMVCTQKMRPSATRYEYTVNFNAVRERIYLKPAKVERGGEREASTALPSPQPQKEPAARPSRTKREAAEPTGTTGNGINRVRNQMATDD